MNEELLRAIEEAEKEGWRLCAGCSYKDDDDWWSCRVCPIETRKLMGLPPEKKED